MRKINLTAIMVTAAMIIAAVGNATAGHVRLKASDYCIVGDAKTAPSDGLVLKFDISKIPSEMNIDLAHLVIGLDIDAESARTVNIAAHAITSGWKTEADLTDKSIGTVDSLFATAFAAVTDSSRVRIDVTDLVIRWHSGILDNNGLIITVLESTEVKSLEVTESLGEIKAELSVFFSK
ncbi:MAG: DNRLRE domain-containing protein [Candidatus Zixiibacteriota bacterium]|nr:MAG: DNRLRE domain-containing protein [candidate division Zixibacteria bacterium]